MKLSIAMMVKNESKYLNKCLSSLKPILDAVSSELIIVDTGSIDNTVEIAKKYTDKLYFHNWNNDFSDMRNITIDYCNGEWIFIIDGDEVLEEPQSIIDALTLKLDKEYNTLFIRVKSLHSEYDLNSYSTLTSPRIFKNDGSFKYEGKVHNQPVHKEPSLLLNSEILHYGYVTNDPELMERKFKRTASILKSELEKRPNDVYYLYQLGKSYYLHKDLQQSIEQYEKAYKILDKKKLKKNFGQLYMPFALAYSANKQYKEAIKICKEGIKLFEGYLDLYYIAANSLEALGDLEEAFYYYKEFIKIYEDFYNYKISEDPAITIEYRNNSYKDVVLTKLSERNVNLNKYEEALKYAIDIKNEQNKIIHLMEIYTKMQQYTKIKDLYFEIKEENKNLLVNKLEEKMQLMIEKEKDEIKNIFSKGEEEYFKLNQFRLKDYKEKDTDRLLKEIDFDKVPSFYGEMILNKWDNKALVFSVLKRLENNTIQNIFQWMIKQNIQVYWKDEVGKEILALELEKLDIHKTRIYAILTKVILLNKMEFYKITKNNMDEKYNNIFEIYIELYANYIEFIYDVDKSRLFYKNLEASEKQMFSIIFAREAYESGKYSLTVKYFKEGAEQYPYLADLLGNYSSKLLKEVL
ncbi:glycosyltransferase family 2 protein [Clostridium botulinum]|uniref:glycosyltransferase family 2 protein n=1 Tax=Clostridium botulinum TaxID=1491 RepID=UPI0009478056|nr:glycosyltransferase family 2 protein [Clostridium botulinum]APQ96084.1 TPR repeat family protein [Clostridium botulinum]MBN3362251.1 glycosyl transferase [Clostridium botulinum]